MPDVVEQRILEQSMRLPAEGAVTGWAACRLHGANFFDGLGRDGLTPLPVPLALGPAARRRAGPEVELHYDRLPSWEVVRRQGIRTVHPVRATFDAVRFAGGTREAVVALEMAVAAGITSLERVAAYVRHRSGWPGVRQVHRALSLAIEHSRSPNETRLRLICTLDAGIAGLAVNCPVHHPDGRLAGVADLLDLASGLVVEYHGAEHRGRTRQHRDIVKEEAFRQLGLEVASASAPDLDAVDAFVGRVRAARDRALAIPAERRRAVLKPLLPCAEADLREREDLNALYAELASDPSI